MTDNKDDSLAAFAPVVTAAEPLLSSALGHSVRLAEVETLTDAERRNVVLRCRDVGAQPATSFIVKKVVADSWDPGNTESWDVQRFFRDWAGVRFLTELGLPEPVSPRYYAGDAALGLFVIEDLESPDSLVEPLLEGTAESAAAALELFARTLGRMHAAGAGKVEEYRRICTELNPAVDLVNQNGPPTDYVGKFKASLDLLGVAPPPGLAADLSDVAEAIRNPGPFYTFIHGDPCPDNILYMVGRMTIIDFEFARFGHALRDGLYGRMPFPTCWCCNQLPPQIVERTESIYRDALAAGCPAASDDDLFRTARLHVAAHWTLEKLVWHLDQTLNDEGRWGIADVRPRVLTTIETYLGLAAASDRLPALNDLLGRLLKSLRLRWPTAEPLPIYPAFR